MSKSFTMHVEARGGAPSWTREVAWDGESPPVLLHLQSDPEHAGFYVKIGRYLTTGDHYRYDAATPVEL